jgi:hypothetical protein
MTENLTITPERVDDIPLLLAQLERRQVTLLRDEHFPTPGNWQGLSRGTGASVWVTFILSAANPRLRQGEPWAAQRLTTLAAGGGQPVRALACSADRRAAVLDYLNEDPQGEAFAQALTTQPLRVYDLQPQRGRLDRTTAKSYGAVPPEGRWPRGPSKDHRADLPPVKLKLSVLAPWGLPLTTTGVAGERAAEPWSLPESQRVQASGSRRGRTAGGVCQRAARQTRATSAARGDD